MSVIKSVRYGDTEVDLHADGALYIYTEDDAGGLRNVPVGKRQGFADLFAAWVTTRRLAVDDYVRMRGTVRGIGSVLALASNYAMVGWGDGRVTAECIDTIERVIR